MLQFQIWKALIKFTRRLYLRLLPLSGVQAIEESPTASSVLRANSESIVQDIKSVQERILQANLDESIRGEVLRAALVVVSWLQKPEEVVMRQAFETHTHNFCLRIGIDLRIFHILKDRNRTPISGEELAKLAGAETQFIIRIMRVITAIGYAREAGERLYVSTPLTMAITAPALEACMIHSSEHSARVCLFMPDYFRINGYKCPTDASNGPFQYALNTDLKFFDYLHQDPRRVKNFNTFMSGNRTGRKHWVEWFPIQTALLSDFLDSNSSTEKSDKIFLVDIGGGKGHDLERLLQEFPQTSGHLILQDLPGTIQSLKDFRGKIQPMAHDIFTPQTVIGAKAYYTHFLLHDFSDDACRIILSFIAKAMRPGYSKLILNETVLPDVGCPLFFAAGDITMMASLAALKRSKKQWIELLESVGLHVVKFWESPDPGDSEAVIEAVVD